MTQENQDNSNEEPTRPEWVDEAESALDRATEAIRAAWDETRDSRMSALGSAKQAARQLGEAIDRGVEAARDRWQEADGEESPIGGERAPDSQDGAGEEE